MRTLTVREGRGHNNWCFILGSFQCHRTDWYIGFVRFWTWSGRCSKRINRIHLQRRTPYLENWTWSTWSKMLDLHWLYWIICGLWRKSRRDPRTGRYSKTAEQLMDLKKQNAKVEWIGMSLEKTDGNQFGLLESWKMMKMRVSPGIHGPKSWWSVDPWVSPL